MVEIAKESLGVYGYKEVEERVMAGAVAKLLVTDGFIQRTKEAGKYTDIKAEIEINCKDSDKAIRPNDKGKVTSYRSTTGYSYSPSTFSDYCFDAQSVVEYYCGKQEVLSRTISCNKGCSAGKCL